MEIQEKIIKTILIRSASIYNERKRNDIQLLRSYRRTKMLSSIKVMVIPIVIGTLGMVPKKFRRNIKGIGISEEESKSSKLKHY